MPLGIDLTDRFQIHTVELLKYNLPFEQLSLSEPIEKWAFFLRRAAELESAELTSLLPEPAFRKATGVLDMISRTPEERLRDDLRLKAMRDRFSELEYNRTVARQEGREEGREEGLEEGRETGLSEGRFAGERIGMIRLLHVLQNLAKEQISSEAELAEMNLEDLTRPVDEIQKRLGV